jgi:hypothetical protein
VLPKSDLNFLGQVPQASPENPLRGGE